MHSFSSCPRSGKILHIVIIFLACAGVITAAWFLPKLGPKYKMIDDRAFTAEQEARLSEKRKEGERHWQAFNNVRAFRKKLEPEDVKTLEKALECYEEFVKEAGLTGDYNPELEKIRKELQLINAEKLREKSAEVEARAKTEIDKKNYAEAEQLYTEALDYEKRIGDECPLSKKKDIARMSHLAQKIRIAQAIPIWNAEQAEEKEARRLEQEGSRRASLEKYTAAREKILLLQKNYLMIVPIEYGHASKLTERIETLKSFDDYEKIESLSAQAEQLAADGKFEDSEATWNTAIRAQEDLSKTYPKSTYAPARSLETLKARRANSLSAPLRDDFAKGLAALDRLVRAGNADEARLQAGNLFRQATELGENFKDMELVSAGTLKRLQYINYKSGDMVLVQKRFNNLFKPVPEMPGTRMMHSEVSQVLYTVIMEENNPSAARGDTLPVDSVTWDDAGEFCRRLGWLIGREVRLPNKAEFLKALGKIDDDALPGQVWSLETADGKTQPVGTSKPNAAGFYDLLGNVAEWVDGSETAPGATAIGGDCQTESEELKRIPEAELPKHDKSRLRGFRVVVIIDDAK